MRKVLASFLIALVAVTAIAFAGKPETASADIRDFRVSNHSYVVVYAMYVSPSAEWDWGGNILGRSTMWPGEQGMVRFNDRGYTCFYDIVFETEGGDVYLWGVDLCHSTEVYVY